MQKNELAAQELVRRLEAAGVDAHMAGGGVHWHVDARGAASRTLTIHVFWYERSLSGLALGINPANARQRPPRVGSSDARYEGPEYLVILHQDGANIVNGRTRVASDAVASAKLWLAETDLEALVGEVPFIDEKPRALRALARQLDLGVRWGIGEEPGCELWLYGQDRSCKVVYRDSLICTLLLGQAVVAQVQASEDFRKVTRAWLLEGVSLRALTMHVASVDLEPHAELLETDAAKWHWLHLRDRMANQSDVLAPLRDLIEGLAGDPVVAAFFTYSSLNRLCFSASSHYPWVDDGLPVVAPAEGDAYLINGDLPGSLAMIETMLAAAPIRPFFGSAPHHEFPLLSDQLARESSTLRPRLVQRGAWYELEVEDATGARRCRVSGLHVAYLEKSARLDATWRTFDDAVRAIRLFCEHGASIDKIAADPAARVRTTLRPGTTRS